MKKRVLFIRSNPVRADSRVQKEVKALLDNDYDVSVLCWDRNQNYALQEEKLSLGEKEVILHIAGIKATFGGGIKKNLLPMLKFQSVIWRFLKTNSMDAVHACDFDTAFTAYHAIKHKKTKLIYDIFDYYTDAFNVPGVLKKGIQALDHCVINKADAVLICTEQRKAQIKGTTPKRLVVIHNTPMSILTEQKTLDSPIIKLAYFGILQEGRMIEEMLDIVAQNKQYELHIGGFGMLEPTVRLFAEQNDNILFYGSVPYEDVLKYESKCDIITAIYDPICPNHIFAAPNKFYEGLMLGKPLIMVKGTGMSHVVADNGIGVLIEYTKESLKNGIIQLAEGKETWPEMSEKMRKLYHTAYSWETMKKRLQTLYKTVMR